MPLVRPGRLFLLMQLSRIVVLYLIYLHGDLWLLVLGTFGWGLNMGVTSNLARAIVQESAAPEFRGRVLSVFSVGMVGSAPIGAIVLGVLIEYWGCIGRANTGYGAVVAVVYIWCWIYRSLALPK